MKLAAAVAIFAASLLFMLLGRVKRDAGGRADTLYLLLGGGAAGLRLTILAAALLSGHAITGSHPLGRAILCVSMASIVPLVLFSYSFPFNRRAPAWLLIALIVPTMLAAAMMMRSSSRSLPWIVPTLYFLPVLGMGLYFQHRNAHAVVREAGRSASMPIRIVQASIAAPWLVATVMMLGVAYLNHGRSLPPPPAVLVANALLGTLAVVTGLGIAVVRYHLLDIRLMAYELMVALGACAAYAAYVVYGASPLFHLVASRGGDTLAAAAVTAAPPLAFRTAWGLLHPRLTHIACSLARRETARGAVVERVMAATARVVDPRGVLDEVSAAIADVTRGRATFFRAGELPPGEYPAMPPSLRSCAALAERPFLYRGQTAELPGEIGAAFEAMDGSLLVPVRRGDVLYGLFAIRAQRLSRDHGIVCATLADQLAIKLENFALYTAAALKSRELHETRALMEQLVQSLPAGICLLDREGRVKAWNRALEKRTGLAAKDALGKAYFDDLYPGLKDSELVRSFEAAIARDPTVVVQQVGVPDIHDPSRYVDVTVATFHDDTLKENGLVVISQDASERIRLEREVEESRRLASLGSFAAAIAHDIRTPLTSIQLNVQILRSRQCLAPRDHEYLDIAIEEIDRLNKSVGEILDYAKPLALDVVEHDVGELLEEAVRTVQPVFAERGIQLGRAAVSGALRVPVDGRRLRQVLVNLLDNAAAASAEGATVELEAHAETHDEVEIRVIDRGKGIPSEHLERIFDPFFTTRPDGTGLGLAIAQKIVRAHGGQLDVASDPGRHTTFTVRLGRARPSSSDTARALASQQLAST